MGIVVHSSTQPDKQTVSYFFHYKEEASGNYCHDTSDQTPLLTVFFSPSTNIKSMFQFKLIICPYY